MTTYRYKEKFPISLLKQNMMPIGFLFAILGSVTKQASLDESVQMDTPPRSPPEPLPDEKLLEMVGPAPIPPQLKERPEMTAKQRWIWAYTKIIQQLNVSRCVKQKC